MSNRIVLEVADVSFGYRDAELLHSISFDLKEKENVSLIGASGFGKTTLLRLIAGDLAPASGLIRKQGLWRRVFQTSTLFPWMTVEENIRVGLRGAEGSLDFQKLVHILDLKSSLNKYPRELSGGLAQRTELARALIGKPQGLLMDEPFSSLDYLLRMETRDYLQGLLREFPMAMILVTHDIPEAVSLTQRTLVLGKKPTIVRREYRHNGNEDFIKTIWSDLTGEKQS